MTLSSTKVMFLFSVSAAVVAMANLSFHSLIKGKVEIGNFGCLIGDN